MSLILTYWEDPIHKDTPDDYDGLFEVRLKTVKQIPDLIAARPENCTMISLEHSGDHRKNGKVTNPLNPRRFKYLWTKEEVYNQPKPKCCPLCKREL